MASRVSLAATGQSQSLEGTVCISAGEMLAAHVLPPILRQLRAAEPGIDVEVVADNAPQDLRRREADIAIRNFRPEDPDLVAKKVGELPARLWAATTYLERIGRPTTLEALAEADFIGFDRTSAMIDYLRTLGLHLTQKNFVFVSQSHFVQWELVKAGLGVGVQNDRIAAAETGVEPALPSLPPIMVPLWVVSHRELHTSGRVRVVFDLLARELAAL